MSYKITVLGSGSWGTALATVLNRNGHQVTIWGRDQAYLNEVSKRNENFNYLPGVQLDSKIKWSSNRDEVSANSDAFVISVPSKFYQTVLKSFQGLIPSYASVISTSKGLLNDKRLSAAAEEILEIQQVAALSGPSHAEEVVHQSPSAVTVAAQNPELAGLFQELFNCPRFRVYSSTDIVGVELGGALKNVIAIAAGVSDGLGFGDNTKAALITRGLAELVRLGTAAGGAAETFMGLSGVGDLIVTCGSKYSRNRGVGERLGKGETMQEIEASMRMIAEGVFNAKTAKHLADNLGVEAPITSEVYRIIYEGVSPSESMETLLSRDPKPE